MKYSTVIGRSDMPFQVFIGGRGIGKTYSALEYEAKDSTPESRFIYMRRTQTELEETCTEFRNPFKTINRNLGLNIEVDIQNGLGLFIRDEEIVGYGCALSTFAKMRGMDFSDVTTTIFDEFIPEKHIHKIPNEGDAFFHFYETVNRNRELDGQPPMKVYLLANAINLNNPILLALGIVSKIAEMKVKGQQRYTNRERCLYVELMHNAEFTDAKKETALYRLSGGTQFSEQALNNSFAYDDMSMIGKVNLSEYVPDFVFGNYTIFSHKSNGNLYIKAGRANTAIKYNESDRDIMYWKFAPRYRLAILLRSIKFDDYATKLVFDSLTKRN